MEEITVPRYILEDVANGIRLAANILDSRKRETAADRQIEFAERLLKWVLGGRIGNHPNWLQNGRVQEDCKSEEAKLKYWLDRCRAAEKCLEESPNDPDITAKQIEAHARWGNIKAEQKLYL